jgi:hypothetical protein
MIWRLGGWLGGGRMSRPNMACKRSIAANQKSLLSACWTQFGFTSMFSKKECDNKICSLSIGHQKSAGAPSGRDQKKGVHNNKYNTREIFRISIRA